VYGLPKDFNGSFFLGHTFDIVCFNENQATFHFGKIMITVESAYSYRRDEVIKVPVKKSDVMELLGAAVLGVEGGQDGTLSLHLDDGHTLKMYDLTPQYESYSITVGDKVIRV
jgi:hypothetical protein